ncbi:hypothetical protein [Staphylococcus warneri]|uniref:hypothetical protein n=1 Tax=Staphylococcus warneri TaxID=1292 RepID=UPI001FB46BB2|nr:hypothetical protein [Staphylococcus warneri]MCJ1786312.1 hypothetical protein [Staphylococcus warneri]MCJ1788753.1 hypothetical protein [Staphylococcus warneri]MCJ1791181.1 hypothetical protein [Staphylococcus warneri]MCJ1793640.1 hypothetical protein [Staphylococcus warneri]MCJ1796143.1 hypothetical protein [Staphylococcus warneri]
MKIEEFQRLGKNVKVIIRKFTENPGKFASVVLQMYWDIEKERDSYKQQRDELINDIAQLRERNVEFEEKLDKEIKLSYEIEKNLYETSKERDELIKSNASVIKYNAELEKKAQAFDEISKLRDNIKFIKDVSLSHATKEPVNQEMYWVHSLMDSLLEGLESEN